jgi:hypothetical protein
MPRKSKTRMLAAEQPIEIENKDAPETESRIPVESEQII